MLRTCRKCTAPILRTRRDDEVEGQISGSYSCLECDGSDCGIRKCCWKCASKDGFCCGKCNHFFTHRCSDGTEDERVICDECLETYCMDCADLKPMKDGLKRCSRCQPWWQKGKAATDFCKDCGSQRQDAIICVGCGERVCGMCPFFSCDACGDYAACESCAKVQYCDKCDVSTCEDCVCDCEKGAESSQDDRAL